MEPTAEEKIKNILNKNAARELPMMHYHGDTVRVIYLLMAVILVITTPFFKYKLLTQSFGAIVAVIGFSVFGGLTNPRSRAVIVIDFLISIASAVIFGYQTIVTYAGSYADLFFLTNVLLFALAVFSLYFSSKTLRGNLLYQK